MKKYLVLLLLAVCFLSVNAQDYVIIVNKNSSLTSITKDQLKNIYTGKNTKLGGQNLTPIDLTDTDPISLSFKKNVLNLTADKYKQFWTDAKIAGKGSAPMIQRNSQAAKLVVAGMPTAIAYVDASVVDATVKKIIIK